MAFVNNPLLYVKHHAKCSLLISENTSFDCQICSDAFNRKMVMIGHVCQGTNGKTTQFIESCEYCESQMEMIRRIQVMRREFVDIELAEVLRHLEYRRERRLHLPATNGMYQDHICEPGLYIHGGSTSRVLLRNFDCDTCITLLLMIYGKTLYIREGEGVLANHDCFDFSCDVCTVLISHWQRYSRVSRMCYLLIKEDYERELLFLERNVKRGYIRKPEAFRADDGFEVLVSEIKEKMFNVHKLALLEKFESVRDKSPISHVKLHKKINVVVEGSIGAGKSVLLDYLKLLDKFTKSFSFYQEPVDKWVDFNGSNLLEMFYSSPKENAFTLQSYINLTKLKQFLEPSKRTVRIYERSLASSQECFTPVLAKNNLISPTELGVLSAWTDNLYKWYPNQLRIDHVIYLKRILLNA